jgi:hypothetical protein
MMPRILAALALTFASSLPAQTAPVDYANAVPIAGSWSYAAASDGSEAAFTDSSARAQLTIHCVRASRQVRISKLASATAPSLFVWTSSTWRNVPATFDTATNRISFTLSAYDPLLDALAFSRGRVAIGSPALILPAYPEIARVVEDCRA